MAGIAFDAVTSVQSSTGTSISYTHTNGTGANRFLFVGFSTNSGSDTITSVTYNSGAMTRIGAVLAFTTGWSLYLYGVMAPATGANTVAVNSSASVSFGVTSVSYTGVKQTNTVDNSGSTSITSNGISKAITPVADNCWVVGVVRNNLTNGIAANVGTTLETSANANAMLDSGVVHPIASTSLGITWTGSADSALIVASIAPALNTGAMFLAF